MSRLTTLIAQARAKDPDLAAALEAEFRALSSRRQFGLNFERHQPEAVELPGRPIRKGDKVRVLPPRGSTEQGDQRLWRVTKVANVEGGRVAHLVLHDVDEPEPQVVTVEDLVVVAEFRDPIYPGLRSTGRVERGGEKPFHTVINAENFHALQTLAYTHRGKVDAIYIDPPYNTGARDWKYNNDYVDGEDAYRHSKWLAFMERRLKLAKQLLNPDDSVLIVTIDEKEYLRLGLLLEQTFPEARIQMVTIVIQGAGNVRADQLSRSEEYAFFCFFGSARPQSWTDDMLSDKPSTAKDKVRWESLLRSGTHSERWERPNLFFPIFVSHETGFIVGIGPSKAANVPRSNWDVPAGAYPVWPIKSNGTEGNWRVSPDALRRLWEQGYVRSGKSDPESGTGTFWYLGQLARRNLADGTYIAEGRDAQGALQVQVRDPEAKKFPPRTVWARTRHHAGWHGTNLLRLLVPDRRFPFPKALYAVEDCVRVAVGHKPQAIVLDFFAGSGTTAHAVMRLNKQDHGRRQSISVTNNEVAADEQVRLRAEGHRAGDADWEALGICDYITKPRLVAAVTGITHAGQPVKGDYKFTDEFPMADGLEENVEFFTLTYETPWRMARNREFEKVAPLLWLRAGAQGRRIDSMPSYGWDVADTYGVIADLDRDKEFQAAVASADTVKVAYIVTDDDRRFQMVASGLPERVEPVRLYESYLNNFEINTGRE